MIYTLLNHVGFLGSVNGDTAKPSEKSPERPFEQSVLSQPVGFHVQSKGYHQE